MLLIGVALFVGQPETSAGTYSGYARTDSGPLTLEVTANPPIGRPGTQMQLVTRITNRGNQPQTPSILIKLPRGTAADIYALPAGATFNLQENRIDWLPLIPAAGVQEFLLNLVVQSTDVTDPEQSITAVLRHQGVEQEVTAIVWIGIPPLLGEVKAQGQVSVGQPVRLHADIAGPGPISTVWDLGDGRRLELDEPEIVYPVAGEYTLSVEASNPGGRIFRQFVLTVLPHPVANFQPDDDAPAIGQDVVFLNSSGGQSPMRVFWDFGDGSTVMGEHQPIHRYQHGGTYRVRLTVENDFGRSEAVRDVTVGEAPIADIVIPDRTAVGMPISGQAFGDDTIVSYLWDMGDGQLREGATISHIYRFPGDYYVSMAADNGFGEKRVGRWVHVDPGMTTLYFPVTANEGDSQSSVSAIEATTALELNPAVASLTETFTLEPISFSPGTTPAEQLLAYINAARARYNLPPMNYGYELSVAAQTHAQDKSRFPDNPHVGTDGTTAAERLLRSGYRGGYAGEATAWGFSDPRLAVEFWMNSDSHRPLLLNQLGTDVGIGYVEDYSSSNVWHWTAEFGINYGVPVKAVLRSLTPATAFGAMNTEIVNYSWLWPLPLAGGERFTVYLESGGRLISLGSIAQPVYGSRYVLSINAQTSSGGVPAGLNASANYDWLVRLEDGRGGVIAESERRLISFTPDPAAVVVASPSPTVAIVTATPAAPTPTATPTFMPTAEPPSNEPFPIIVTATAQPSP